MQACDAVTCFKNGDQCRIFLGVGVLGIHQLKVELPRPLSPPSFIHTSSAGIAPSCQVRPLEDLKISTIIMCEYLLG